MRKFCLTVLLLFSSSIFFPVKSEDACSNYPTPGFSIESDENGDDKFLATAEVVVPIDDRRLYLDALEEAEIEANLKIANFINKELAGDININTKTDTEIIIEGENKTFNDNIVKTKLKVLSQKTPKTLLRGVRPLGSCYVPGQAVRVSVGWKLQDLDAAEKAGNAMSQKNPRNNYNSRKFQSSRTSGSSGNSGNYRRNRVNFSPVPGYSDTRRIESF